MKHKLLLTLSLTLASTSLGQVAPPPAAQGVIPALPTPAEQLRAGRGSLMRAALASGQPRAGQISLFAVTPPEPRMLKKHDLVQIIVREESNYSSEGATELKKEASVQAKLNEFIRFDPGSLTIKGGGIGTAPGVDLTASREMKGDAAVDRKDSFTARITAEVLDVKPNGTVVLQARKHIKTDDEEQTIVIAGTCRAEDVTAANTVLSNQLHDLDLTKVHKGAVRDNTRRGWLTKLLDAANPF